MFVARVLGSTMASNGVIFRKVEGRLDVEALVALTEVCFPEEARATGMSAKKWRDIKTDELLRNPDLWEQCGERACPSPN